MRKLGKKRLTLTLTAPLAALPASLQGYALSCRRTAASLTYSYSENGARRRITALLKASPRPASASSDLRTEQSSLEDIFVSLIGTHA